MKKAGSTAALDLICQLYPKSSPASQAIDRLYELIRKKVNISPEQILHADSICCDEVNAIQYPVLASKMLGPFKLGGLSGYPFAGLTAMNTVAQHVPEEGALLISYGPHIGISSKGIAGELRRTGQSSDSICCGAVITSLNKLKENAIVPGSQSIDDFQINQVQQILLQSASRIQEADNQVMEATEVMYESIDAKIQQLVLACDYLPRHVFIAGILLINSDFDEGAFYQLRRLEHFDTQLQTRTSWLETFNSEN